MPGTTIETAVRTGPSATAGGPGTRYFVTGQSFKGPTGREGEPGYVLARSLAELREQVGGVVPFGFVDDDARVFFEELFEGGADLCFARVAGDAAAAASHTFQTAGALAAVKVDAVTVGSWANAGGGEAVKVAIAAGNPGTVNVSVLVNDVIVEVFRNLGTNADIAAALLGSDWVRGTDLGPVGGALPAPIAATALAGGANDSASVTAADLTDAFARFTDDLGSGVCAVPGYSADLVEAALEAHCKASRSPRIAYVNGAPGTTDVEAEADVAALQNSDGGEFVGYFWPSLVITNGPRSTKVVSPTGYMAAVRARAFAFGGGPWEVPAGDLAVVRSSVVVGTDVAVTDARADELDAAGVSVIRTVNGRAEAYGYRSLFVVAHPLDENPYELLKERDILNWLTVEARRIMSSDVFRTIDGQGRRLKRLEGELRGLCMTVRQAGGIFPLYDDAGALLDEGFTVDAGTSLNTRATLQQNRLRAALAVRTSPSAAKIELLITKASLTAGV